MKTFALTAFCLALAVTSFAQTLFTYGGKPVSKTEFLNAFNRNPSTDTSNRKQALKSYLDLYIKYKLKVAAAYDEKLNLTDQYINESQSFKRELAETAMNNEADVNAIVKEAFGRSQKDIHLSQIFVPAHAGSDTSDALKKINEAYSVLSKGTSFTELADKYAQDTYTKQTHGTLALSRYLRYPIRPKISCMP